MSDKECAPTVNDDSGLHVDKGNSLWPQELRWGFVTMLCIYAILKLFDVSGHQ